MSDKKSQSLSRKEFLKNSSLGFAGAALGSSLISSERKAAKVLDIPNYKKKYAANDRIQIASIGMGIIANYDVPAALKVPGVELVAVADCYDSRLVHTKEEYGNDVFTTKDYREILTRDDVDAVLAPVPDHWHTRISIDAMKAGKDVYCEKPMVHKIREGKQIIRAHEKTGQKMQVGSQYASNVLFQKAKEMYEAGAIGRLEQVDAAYNRNSAIGAWQYSIPEDATPKTVDWDTFLGDAPKVPWDPKRFFRWRNYQDYGEGIPGDLFVHLLTGVHTVTGSKGPTQIAGTGGLRHWHDGRNVPDVIFGQYAYPKTEAHPDFTLTLRSNLADGGGSGHGNGFQFIGDEGIIEITFSTIKLTRHRRRPPSLNQLVNGYNSVMTFSKKVQEEFKRNYKQAHADSKPQSSKMDHTTTFRTPDGYDARLSHMMNFFDSVRNGSPVFEDPVFGFRAAAPALLTNKSYRENRIIHWDPEKMQLINK
jgi:predicted dehydrogenase